MRQASIAFGYNKFQSSPSPKAGRSMIRGTAFHMVMEFQSSPSPKAGRSQEVWQNTLKPAVVSILAQPEGRTQPRQSRHYAAALRFQSSPSPKAGRSRTLNAVA